MLSENLNQNAASNVVDVLFHKTRKSIPRSSLMGFLKKRGPFLKNDRISVDTDVLKSKVPLKFLPDTALKALTDVAVITQHKKGDVLFEGATNDNLYVFLVWGFVEFQAPDSQATGQKIFIKYDQQPAYYSLANSMERRYTARAGFDGTSLLWIKREVVDKYFSEHDLSDVLDIGRYEIAAA